VRASVDSSFFRVRSLADEGGGELEFAMNTSPHALKNHPMKTIIFANCLAVMLAAGLTSFEGTARGGIIQLTGGDPSDGLALDPNSVVAAIYTPADGNFSQSIFPSATQTFQGVTFFATPSSIARGGPSGSGVYLLGALNANSAGFSDSGSPSTQDDNLLSLINAGAYFNSEYLTFTVSDLAPNTSYRIDTLSSNLGFSTPRSFTVSYNGGSVADTLAISGAETNYIYAIQDVVSSNGAGEILIRYDKLTGDGPTINALVVSAVAVPEPSTYAMALAGLVCGGYSMWRRRRLRRLKAA
jgi:hypothetical protein